MDTADKNLTSSGAVAPALDIVIPVYNEQTDLERSVRRLHNFVRREIPLSTRITIADNASTDDTWQIAQRLMHSISAVTAVRLDVKGRGNALKQVWLASDAEVLAYMDVDLSTDLRALLPLVTPLLSGHSQVAIGTRLDSDSHVTRGARREFISRCYNLLLRTGLHASFSDAQCGFKAIRADAARELLPLVEDTGWFFDTELLVLAEHAGMRIHEVPVDWVDDPDSRVDVVDTARKDLEGMARLWRQLRNDRLPLKEIGKRITGEYPQPDPTWKLLDQILRFGLVGVVCTLAHALLYWWWAGSWSAVVANTLALLATALLNTGLNRGFTFGVRGRAGLAKHHGQGLIVFALAWSITTGSLLLLQAVAPASGRGAELVVIVIGNLVATLLRFTLLRHWVFAPTQVEEVTPTGVSEPTSAGAEPTTVHSSYSSTQKAPARV